MPLEESRPTPHGKTTEKVLLLFCHIRRCQTWELKLPHTSMDTRSAFQGQKGVSQNLDLSSSQTKDSSIRTRETDFQGCSDLKKCRFVNDDNS